MSESIHCPMIHGGLHINLNEGPHEVRTRHCCLGPPLESPVVGDIWHNIAMVPQREKNLNNIWNPGCFGCRSVESSGQTSFRTGMLEKFGIRTNLSGPQRLDLMFDAGCNLACRTCGPGASTFWQKHLIDNGLPCLVPRVESRANDMIALLETLDLSNLEMVVFCGGETLLGNAYWRVSDAISKLADPKKITLSFQTNGTQSVPEKYFDLIEKFHLIKLNISLDGVGKRFEYLRWPAEWDQVVSNINKLKDTLPINVMFLIEETISIFNLYYQNELDTWVKNNYSVNRLGDAMNHTRHIASGIFSLDNLSKLYVDSLPENLKKLVPPLWVESPEKIKAMIYEIKKFDQIRKQDWTKTFPEVAKFYLEYI